MMKKIALKRRKFPILSTSSEAKLFISTVSILLVVLLMVRKPSHKLHHQNSAITDLQQLHDIVDTECRDEERECPSWAEKNECIINPAFMNKVCKVSCKQCKPTVKVLESFAHEDVILSTEYGKIRIHPYIQKAPKTCSLILNLAHSAKSGNCSGCNFYRSEEAPPHGSSGPPYGLFQGSLPGLLWIPPVENIPSEMKRGHVAMIPNSMEFFINVDDHDGWGVSMTVWGEVSADSLAVVDSMVAKLPYHSVTHPRYKTVMQMLDQRVNFTIAVVTQGSTADVLEGLGDEGHQILGQDSAKAPGTEGLTSTKKNEAQYNKGNLQANQSSRKLKKTL